jgi:hypothetical protein
VPILSRLYRERVGYRAKRDQGRSPDDKVVILTLERSEGEGPPYFARRAYTARATAIPEDGKIYGQKLQRSVRIARKRDAGGSSGL